MSPICGANVTLGSRTNVAKSTMSPIGGKNVTDYWSDCHISVE